MLRMDDTTKLLIKRGIRRGFITLKREKGYFTSTGALAGVVLLLQMFLLLTAGVRAASASLRTHTDLRLELQQGTADQEAQEFFVAVQGRPEVEEAVLITREQAYERERAARPELISFLEKFQIENPFADTVAVTLKTLDAYDDFVAFITQPQWQQVVDAKFLSEATGQEQELQAMLQVASAGTFLTDIFLTLVCLILLAVLVELMRRRALQRRDEVFVERMSGAPELSVVLPFATEATLLLLASLLVSSMIVAVLLALAPGIVEIFSNADILRDLAHTWMYSVWSLGPFFLLLQILLIPFLGLLGAYLGTRGSTVTLAKV